MTDVAKTDGQLILQLFAKIFKVEGEREELKAALRDALAHVQELRVLFQRGVLSVHDGSGGTYPNRNVDVEVKLRALLAKLAEE